jgi:acyl-CoA reductase-like NAD-dependent aldehyde dehydrogenase
MATAAAPTDRDRTSQDEARRVAEAAKRAAAPLAELTQIQIDRIVEAMAAAARARAEEVAALAVEETGFGIVADKVAKNLFAATRVFEFIRPMKTVGVVGRDDAKRVIEIAEPFGVVAAIIPSTNPTSTAIYKILIALKARCRSPSVRTRRPPTASRGWPP